MKPSLFPGLWAWLLLWLMPLLARAELTQLSDADMLQVTAQGQSLLSFTATDVSAVSDDFYLKLGFDSGIPTEFRKLSVVGADSADPFNNTRGFSIGSDNDPFILASQDDSFTDYFNRTSNTHSLVLAFPRGSYVNEGSASSAHTFNLTTLMSLEHLSGNALHTWLSFRGVSLDDSYFKFWANAEDGLNFSGVLNLKADQLLIDADNQITAAPGSDPDDQWLLDNLDISLPLGNTLYQPLTMKVKQDLNVVLELKAIDLASAQEFDRNAASGHIKADNIALNGYDLGSVEIEGIRLQYLRVETHDLF